MDHKICFIHLIFILLLFFAKHVLKIHKFNFIIKLEKRPLVRSFRENLKIYSMIDLWNEKEKNLSMKNSKR